jgi:hypothetical protein
MKCAHIQRFLLTAERPDRIGADMRRHLDGCAACRAVQRRLLRLERDLTLLPVPPTGRLPAFIGKFLQHTPVNLPAVESALLPLVPSRRRVASAKERGLRKLAVSIALAASLAFVVFGLWAFSPNRSPLDDPARPHRARLAVRLRDEVRELAQAKNADGERMAALAVFYRELLNDHLKQQIRATPPGLGQRAWLDGLEASLNETDSEFTLLATLKPGTKAGNSLTEIALAARQTSTELNALVTE